MNTRKDVLTKIQRLVDKPGYIYVLSLINRHDFFYSPDEAADVNWYERLHQNELSFLFGLLVKKPINFKHPSETEVNEYVNQSYKLLKDLHDSYTKQGFAKMIKEAKGGKKRSFGEFFGSGNLMVEPIFYGESGAYDFQFWEFSPDRYAHDREWLKNKRIDISEFVEISKYIKKKIEEKATKLRPGSKLPKDIMDTAFETFCIRKADLLKNFNEKILNRFIELFTIVPGGLNKSMRSPGDYNEIEVKPLINVGKDTYYVSESFNLAKSIYESPFYWMVKDLKYEPILSENRGKTTVELAKNLLIPVFGNENVYRDVVIETRKGKYITDIDLLAIAGNKGVVLQAKSKKLTLLSRQGKTSKLKEDFNEAVQEAYNQALKSKDFLLSSNKNYRLKENNKIIKLKEKLDDVYLICLTGDHYPAVLFQTRSYLKKKKSDPYSLPISIFDLELLAHYLKDPFDFLYYLRQRINTAEIIQCSGEISYLAYHLKHKLIHTSKGINYMMLDDSFAQYIDANFPVVKGYQPAGKETNKVFHEWKNEEFNKLIKQVKGAKNTGFTDAVFMLNDLSGEAADELIKMINDVRRKTRTDNRSHSLAVLYGDFGVSYICVPSTQSGSLFSTLISYSTARKYRSKANVWLGMGSFAENPNLVNEIVFSKEPWKLDERLEKLATISLNPGMVINPLKKIGRNDPCICGSGIKYKKCCGSPKNQKAQQA